jgi:hypothetical protein
LAFLAIVIAAIGLINAFGMTPPYYALEVTLGNLLNTRSEPLVLGLVILLTGVVVPLALAYGAAWLGRTLTPSTEPLNRVLMRHAYSFVPLGFAIWFAHYLFHFMTGAMTIVPAFQTFFAQTLQWPILGEPNWTLAARFVPSVGTIQLIQTIITYGGLLAAVLLTMNAARRTHNNRRHALIEALPWIALLVLLAAASGMTFLLPMEMRGSALSG